LPASETRTAPVTPPDVLDELLAEDTGSLAGPVAIADHSLACGTGSGSTELEWMLAEIGLEPIGKKKKQF
jgi:hypothetical protein